MTVKPKARSIATGSSSFFDLAVDAPFLEQQEPHNTQHIPPRNDGQMTGMTIGQSRPIAAPLYLPGRAEENLSVSAFVNFFHHSVQFF